MFCRPSSPCRNCAIVASPLGHSQDCFSHIPSHFLLQTVWHSELPRKLPGEKPKQTNVFPLWFVPEGSHNTVQTHQILVLGGEISNQVMPCCFSMDLYCLFSSLYYFLLALVVFFEHAFFFFFFYPGNLIFILRAIEFVGKPILYTQWIFISILLQARSTRGYTGQKAQ